MALCATVLAASGFGNGGASKGVVSGVSAWQCGRRPLGAFDEEVDADRPPTGPLESVGP